MVLALLVVGFAVTNDGGGYILLGDVLQHNRFPEDWDFVREPGLPLLLRLTVLSHVGIQGYLIVSGFLAGLAVALVGGAFFDVGRHWQRLVGGLAAISASIYISYAGWVMQQVGMAVLLALVGWNVRLIQTADGIRPVRLISLGCLGAIAIYFSFVFAPVLVVAVLLATVIVARRIKGISARRKLAAGLALVSIAAIPFAAYLPWHEMKQQKQARLPSGGDLPGYVAGGITSGLSGDDRVDYLRDRLGTTFVLLHLTGPAEWVMATDAVYSEDILWAEMRYAYRGAEPRCGVFDMQPSGVARTKYYLAGKQYCAPIDGSGWLRATATPSHFVGGIASLAMIAGSAWALVRRRELIPILAIPWTWLATFAVFEPTDRYAIPIWPYKMMFGFLMICAVMGAIWSTTMRARRAPRESQRGQPSTSEREATPRSTART